MTAIREAMKSGSISAASRQLGRTQTAISATVKELKKKVNFQLSKREKGRLMPMQETFFLLEKATEILQQVDELQQLLQAGVEASPTKITVSSMPVVNKHFLPGIIANSPKTIRKPDFRLRFRNHLK